MPLIGLRSAATCGACGKGISADSSLPASFCPDCGCCVLRVSGAGVLHPLVPPGIGGGSAWLKLRATLADSGSAALTGSRLLFVPFHEWAPDLGTTRLARDARAAIAPAADLLPAGFPQPRSPRGDDRRGLRLADTAHRGRLADPADLMDLIRLGEPVDVMIPPPTVPPPGAAASAEPRLLYYPFWFLTYRLDWKEHRGVIDAVTGRPIGASAPPRRWAPAITASGVALAVFAGLYLAAGAALQPIFRAIVASAGSWAAFHATFSRLLRRERAR